MTHGFRIVALPRESFLPLFDLDAGALRARGIERRVVTEHPGIPCRVSLADAPLGESVLLLPHVHHDVASPYRASGPIFVRERAATAHPAPGEIPPMLAHRLLSVRAYDAQAMLVAAEVVPGESLRDAIGTVFARPSVAYMHLHNARPGCYNCRVERV